MTGFLDQILHLSPVWVYVVVALLVFAEDAIFVGFVIPGETAAVLAGVATALGRANLAVAIVVVVAAAIIGDSVGYEVGKHLGPKLLNLKILRKRRAGLDRALDFLRRRGGLAVFLGRSIAFFRAVMPALAGMALMPYRRFLVANAAGGLVWGVATVLLGFLAGNSYQRVEKAFGRGAAIALAAVVLLALGAWILRRRRSERR